MGVKILHICVEDCSTSGALHLLADEIEEAGNPPLLGLVIGDDDGDNETGVCFMAYVGEEEL